MFYVFVFFFFFFQAEDGIRDLTVTGVQTCALPIYRALTSQTNRRDRNEPLQSVSALRRHPIFVKTASAFRSEEHTSELQSQSNLVCRLLLEKKKKKEKITKIEHADIYRYEKTTDTA